MTATPGTPTTSATPNTTTNTSLTVAGLQTAANAVDVVEITGYATGTAINPTMTTPTGWIKVGENMQATGTPATWVGVYVRVAGANGAGNASSQLFSWANAGQMVAVATPWTGADTTTPVPWSVFANKAASGTAYAISGTAGAAGTLAYGFACRTSPGTWSGGTLATDTGKGATALSSGAAIATAYQSAAAASGDAVSKSGTGPSTSIGQQWAYVIAAGASAQTLSPTGVGSAETFGTPAVSVAGGTTPVSPTGVPSGEAFGTATVGRAAANWVRQRSGGTQYVAHRDGFWGTYGEETLEGYAAAAAYNSGLALEISVRDTSDGVYVCSHDAITGRVFTGTNYTINSVPWSTLSPNGSSTVGRPTTLVGGNPMRRLEEILDAFPNHVFVVENKHGTNQSTLVALLEAHAPGRWIFKGPYNDTANANTSAAAGAPVWLYFYPTDLPNLSSAYTALAPAVADGVPIIFGLGDYSASPVPVQSDANTFFTFTAANGIYTWAHILGTTAQKSTADGQAASAGRAFDGYMMSAVSALAPTDAITPTGIGSAEAFGTAAAAPGPVRVAPAGIGSSEAFGAPSVTTGGRTLAPVGITSAEAFGATVVAGGLGTLAPTGIASAQALGVPALAGGSSAGAWVIRRLDAPPTRLFLHRL